MLEEIIYRTLSKDRMDEITLKRCSRCILPETFPSIKFDEEGICNYCRNYKKIRVKGGDAFEREIAKFRNRGGAYDCMVTISGGRDSSYVLYRLVNVNKLRVLACTFKCGIQSELGERNAERMCKILGVDHVIYPYKIDKNLRMIKRNFRAWIKKPSVAMIPIFMLADKTMEYHMRKVAKKNGISLIIDGESRIEDTLFKSGFLGVPAIGHGYNLKISSKLELLVNYIKEYLKNPRYFFTFDPVENLVGFLIYFYGGIFYKDITLLSYFNYFMWNEKEIVSTNIKELDWELPDDTALTWRNDDAMPPLYNYLYYRMVGFTENDTLRSNMIRNNMMSREEALKIVYLENKPRIKAIEMLFEEKLKLPIKLLDNVPAYVNEKTFRGDIE